MWSNNSEVSAAPANFFLGSNFAAATNLTTSTSFPIVNNQEENSVTDVAANQGILETHIENSNAGTSNGAPSRVIRVYAVSPQQIQFHENQLS